MKPLWLPCSRDLLGVEGRFVFFPCENAGGGLAPKTDTRKIVPLNNSSLDLAEALCGRKDIICLLSALRALGERGVEGEGRLISTLVLCHFLLAYYNFHFKANCA